MYSSCDVTTTASSRAASSRRDRPACVSATRIVRGKAGEAVLSRSIIGYPSLIVVDGRRRHGGERPDAAAQFLSYLTLFDEDKI
jgi:hypothetical protein